MLRFTSFLLVLMTLQLSAPGQLSPSFRITYYNTENGLPSNGLKGMQWDEKTGFLWIATEAGIVRFNGIDFKTYTNKNTSFITAERIRFITQSRQGAIYAVDETGNLLKVQQNDLISQPVPEPPSRNLYFNFYALSASDSFFYYKLRHPAVGEYDFSKTAETLPLTDTSIVFIKNQKPFYISRAAESPLAFVNAAIETGFQIGDKFFLVSATNEVFLVDINSRTLSPVSIRGPGLSLKEIGNACKFFRNTGSGDPIMISGRNAWQLAFDGTSIVADPICDAIPDNLLILFIQFSKEKKLLFLGTDSKGLIVISQNRVAILKKKQANINTSTAYYSQVELPGNNILTNDGDVIGESETVSHNVPSWSRGSYSVYPINDSLLWFCKSDGFGNSYHISCYNYKTRLTTTYTKIRIGTHFALCYSGRKFIIATDEGLGILQQDSLHFLYKRPRTDRSSFAPFDMVEISPGVFIIAFCSHLIRFNTVTNSIDTLSADPNSCFRTLWKYKDYLFIGTYGKGYYIYRNGKLKAMPLDKNNFLAYTHCFMPDAYGYCWISTNRGLFKVSVADIVNAYEKDEPRIYYHYIGRRDGMDITEMNGGCTPCALQMKNGVLSFPTMDGLLWVNPGNATMVLPGGNIFIDDILVDDKKQNPDSLASKFLPADTKEVLVRLGFAAWCNKENIYIDYELNNSGKWNPVNAEDGVIRLYGFEKGENKLRIRKINGFGINNYAYEEFKFYINTPWYNRWWFYVLAGLVAFAVVWAIFKIRTRQYKIRQRKLEQQVFEKTKELQQKNAVLQKNDTIKTRLISIISHDIITPLKFLTVTGKNLRQRKALMSEELQKEALNEITNTSQEIHLLSTNILNWIKYQNENRRLMKEVFNVHELVNEVLGLLNSLAKEKNLEVSNEVDKDLLLSHYAEPLKILIYNFVSNAIRFSDTGKIIILNTQKEGNVIISIKDEGIGMTTEQIHNIMSDQIIVSSVRGDGRNGNGLGYLIVKDLMRMIDVSISIESEKGKGTIVSVVIPVKK